MDQVLACDTALERLYGCVLDPRGWSGFVDTFRALGGAKLGQYFLWNGAQLKAIFDKTATHRQAELVALLSALPALEAAR